MKNNFLPLLMSAMLFLPVYPASKKISEKKEMYGTQETTRIEYESSQPIPSIIEYYAQKLTEQGWNVLGRTEATLNVGKMDLSQVDVECAPLPEGKNYILVTHSSALSQEMINAMVGAGDFPGKDISSIPRYPGAMRTGYSKSENTTVLTYKVASNCFDCVAKFYQKELPARGWGAAGERFTTIGSMFKSKAERIKNTPADIAKNLPPGFNTQEIAKGISDLAADTSDYPMAILEFRNPSASATVTMTAKEGYAIIIIYFTQR